MTASKSLLPKMRAGYQFQPMSSRDLPMVRAWLAAPHVREWWGDADEQFDLVSGDLNEPAMDQFVVTCAGRPIRYICNATTRAHGPDNGLGMHPPSTRGIDQFIGEPDMIDRGHRLGFDPRVRGRPAHRRHAA